VASQSPGEPRHGDWWFNPNPLFYVDVENWLPGASIVLTADTPGHPVKRLGDLPAGDWSMQAIVRTSERSANPLTGDGTVISTPQTVSVTGMPTASIALNTVAAPKPVMPAGMGLELFATPSPLLSEHFQSPFQLRAIVRMPKEATDLRTVPTLYVIGGFPGALESSIMIPWLFGSQPEAEQLAIVYLEAQYRGGHSAFVDSPSGGPWGTALVTELIPALEEALPLQPRRDARFLTGHSSGGWSSLWLALEYPDVFGGTLSTAPDPVDFTRFQTVDIYAPDANLFRTHDGARAPLARSGNEVMAWADNFIAMETALGDGGQMRSFEWTFSPRGDDGRPVSLCDRTTGVIDPAVAAHWRQFDIAHRITQQWDTLEPVLRDRVHIVMGTQDTFYLDAAARSLDAMLTQRGLPHVVELVPGDHSSILTRAMAKRIMQQALSRAQSNPLEADESTRHTP
jgi:S-formylglutathione hydrolase FrmB